MLSEQPTCACGPECPRALAAEAERDHAVREVQLMQGSFAAVTSERDRERTSAQYWHGEACRLIERATRLAALEQAVRGLKAESLLTRMDKAAESYMIAVGAVFDALDALDRLAAPPGEEA